MTTAFIVGLVIIAGYLGKRWRESNTENVELRARVDSLQRRLARQRR